MAKRDDAPPPTAMAPWPASSSPVRLSVLAPIQNENSTFQAHVLACHDALADLGAELVLLDNQSINGCTHGLPRDVLIVRMETEQRPAGLWRHGRRLASGASLLWLPKLAACKPGILRSLVLSTQPQAPSSTQTRRRAMRLRPALGRICLVSAGTISRLRSLASLPWVGQMLARIAERWLVTANVLSIDVNHVTSGPEPERSIRANNATNRASLLSVIITAHDEGDEVLRTVHSVRAHTAINHEILVIDDGSTDGSCDGLERLGVRVIKLNERIGVAYSRDLGTRNAAGDAFAYLDGHQRVDPGCLDRATALAIAYQAITCPPCRPLYQRYPIGYGASFRLSRKHGVFDAYTRTDRPRHDVTWISALRSPGYVIPRTVYDRVTWIDGLRGWGATDLSLGVKTFFTDVNILYVDIGATHHLFRKAIPYLTTDEAVWRNHALIARVCFDERTWNRYWYPEVFRLLLTDDAMTELDSPSVRTQHAAFQERKTRPDREFWRGLLRVDEPKQLR